MPEPAWPPVGLPTPYYQDEACLVYHADCLEVLPLLAPGSIDAIITDPPYGTGWVRGTGRAGEFVATKEKPAWDVWTTTWLLPDVPTAFFAPNSRLESVQPVSRGVLWWEKTNPRPGGPSREAIVLTHAEKTGVFTAYNGDTLLHPCEKPLSLMRWIIRTLEYAGVLLDPFMGSGTTLVAAKDLGRRAIGIELEERYCAIAVKRLRQEVLPFPKETPHA